MKLERRFSLVRLILIGVAPALVAAAIQPRGAATAKAVPQADLALPPLCVQVSATAAASVPIGVTQILPEAVPLASCEVRSVALGQRARWFLWKLGEADSLLPLQNKVYLRNWASSATGGGGCFVPQYVPDSVSLNLDPPIVLTSVPQVAETLSSRLAVDVFSGVDQQNYKYAPAAPGLPSFQFSTSDLQHRAPLQGGSTSLAFSACRGPDAYMDLRVVQSVMRADTTSSLLGDERMLLQTFRVPQATDVRWVELAFGSPVGFGAGSASIMDPQGATVPLVPLPGDLIASGQMGPEIINPTPAWAPVLLMSRSGGAPAMLLPNHTYWLVASSYAPWALHERVLEDSESADFNNGVGLLYVWNGLPAGGWRRVASRALAFRLIGVPQSAAPSDSRDGTLGALKR